MLAVMRPQGCFFTVEWKLTEEEGTTMKTRARLQRGVACAVVGGVLMMQGVAPAGAHHEPGPETVCDGQHFTLYPTASDWSAFGIKDTSTHFITVAFEVTATDAETGEVYGYVYEAKGNGHAHPNQETVVCTFSKQVFVEGPPANGRWVEFAVTRWAVPKP